MSYFGYNLPNDDADFFNEGLLRYLFPEHRHALGVGGYSRTAPLGEIFDILQPGSKTNPAALANYKVLFALAGMTFDAEFSKTVMGYVRNGGTLVIHAPDITEHLPPEFLGLELTGETVPGGGSLAHSKITNPRKIYTCCTRPNSREQRSRSLMRKSVQSLPAIASARAR